jgi:hypothetical protein
VGDSFIIIERSIKIKGTINFLLVVSYLEQRRLASETLNREIVSVPSADQGIL